jgi:hypothetical protein
MQDLPTDTKQRMPSSQVLEEVIHQAPAEYVTVGWLTSTLHQHSFGIIMLSLGPEFRASPASPCLVHCCLPAAIA